MMLHHRCVIAGALGMFAVLVVGDRPMVAQAAPPVPSVSVRRLTSLTSRVVTGDFNGDGIVDLASTSATPTAPRPIVVALGGGDSTFNTPRSAGINGGVLAAGDFNNDGKLDQIAAEDSDDAPLRLLPGNGDGTLAEFGHFNSTGRGAWRVVTGDFNRDGILDIATANRSAIAIDDCGPRYKTWDSISIITGRGDGTFTPSGSTDYSIGNQQNLDDPRYRNAVTSLTAPM
jgi:FG-GAP-like repeat